MTLAFVGALLVLGALVGLGSLSRGGGGLARAQADPAVDTTTGTTTGTAAEAAVRTRLAHARDERDDLAQERELLHAVLPPPGVLLVLDVPRIDVPAMPLDLEATHGATFLSMLRHVPVADVGAFAARYAFGGQSDDDAAIALALVQEHLALQAALNARITALDARIAELDDRIASLEAVLDRAPSTFDWDLTGTWHAVRNETWGAPHLDDERATLRIGSLTDDGLPTLQLEIENAYFVPGWKASLSLRPRPVDVQAMLDGGPVHTIYPVGTFDGPRAPLSPAKEHSGPDDAIAHHCSAWDALGGIGRITVVDRGGPDERLELELRFAPEFCRDDIPVEIYLTFRR